MAVGAQMKIAHKLRSAEHISKRELQRVLSGSLEASNFDVEQYQMEQMIEGIMKVIMCRIHIYY
jgi:glutamyl/glutaminyl-tRNA synthetase